MSDTFASERPLSAEVAIVGGGPAGAITAALLAGAGHDVVLLERATAYRWRACGVFSWSALAGLRSFGLTGAELARVARPIPTLRLVAPDRTEVRLSPERGGSGGAGGGRGAAGFDRSALDPLLLDRARAARARVCEGATVSGVTLGRGGQGRELALRGPSGGARRPLRVAVLVGADGIRSIVAREAGVLRAPPLAARIGLTYHVAERPGVAVGAAVGAAGDAVVDAAVDAAVDVAVDAPSETAMLVFPGGYCGVAPVPGGRLNVGIVLDGRRFGPCLRAEGATATATKIVRALARRDPRLDAAIADGAPLDRLEGAAPLAHAVSRVAGPDWLLVGDAAGFLDPFTGEGLGRAVTSAVLAADAVHRRLRGEAAALDWYASAYRREFRDRDRLTLLVQQFLARPALLGYAARRLVARPRPRATLEGVLAEAIPAARGLDPRFLASLLRP